MAKDLTTSHIDRQNILNNDLAINEIQNKTNCRGVLKCPPKSRHEFSNDPNISFLHAA